MTISRRRWIAKKLARRSVALTMASGGAFAARQREPAAPSVRGLMYHRFGSSTRDPWCVDQRVFESQMRWLAEQGLAVSLADMLGFARGERSLPAGAVLVTSDDGYRSVLTHMAPVLRDYGIPAVAFLTTGRLGNLEAARSEPEPYLSWDEAGRLHELGVTIGSHAHTHRSLGRLPLSEAREEGERSRALLRDRLGVEAHTFAYPYGMRPDYNSDTTRVLVEVGYEGVFVAQHGAIRRGAGSLDLPRIKVEGGEGISMFKFLCRGAMDVWRVFDDRMWRLQRPQPG